MLRWLARVEIFLGVFILLTSVCLYVLSFIDIDLSMTGGLLAYYGALFGACFVLAGLAFEKGVRWYATAHAPIVYSVVLFVWVQ